MIQIIKNFFEAKRLESENRIEAQKAYTRFIHEASDFVLEKPTDGNFVKIDAQGLDKGHIEANQIDMVKQARKFYRSDPHARSIIDSMVHFVMGKGLSIMPKSKDLSVWYTWREFWNAERNGMGLRQFEIPTRLFRDGEVFIQTFSKDADGKSTGKTTIRFIDPLQVKNPAKIIGNDQVTKTTRSGIETDPNDVEKVIAYWVQDRVDANLSTRVPASDIIHLKIFADSDQLRGETFFQTIMSLFTHYMQWLDNRILLNKMRSAIVLIRKVEGTPTQVAQIADQIGDATRVRSGETKKLNIRGGSILNASAGISYEMLSPNINAPDVKDDGRNMKLAMAAGTNLPEYILGDASNANYSSTMIAESPFVKAIEYWQIYLENFYAKLFRIVVQNAVEAGLLNAPSDDEFLKRLKGVAQLSESPEDGEELSPRDRAMAELMPEGKMETPTEIFYGIDVQWPEIIHRDIKALTDSLMVQRQNGWISDPTASSILGYDYQEEVRKQKQIEDQAEKTGNPFLSSQSDPNEMNMSNEIMDIFGSLTPEEKQRILSSNDPKEVAALMFSRTGSNGNGNGPGNDPQED